MKNQNSISFNKSKRFTRNKNKISDKTNYTPKYESIKPSTSKISFKKAEHDKLYFDIQEQEMYCSNDPTK